MPGSMMVDFDVVSKRIGASAKSLKATAIDFGTVSATTSSTTGTATTVTATVPRMPQRYSIQTGNGYIVSMTYSGTTATFTVASAAVSQSLVIQYEY